MNDFIGNDLCNEIIAQYISEVKETKGDEFTEDDINLAELERRTGISRGRLRRFRNFISRKLTRIRSENAMPHLRCLLWMNG